MSGSAGVVLVGGGLASQRCAEVLRAHGYEGRIRMICKEELPPYDRPPLSKGVLVGSHEEGALPLRPAGWHSERGVEMILGSAAVALHAGSQRLDLSDGSTLDYDKLLVATGSRARTLPALDRFSNALELRTLEDAQRLRCELEAGGRLVIAGFGFIGQEVASSARSMGCEVTIVEALPLPLAPLLGEYVGRWLVDRHRVHGVDVRTSTRIVDARGGDRVEEIELDDGTILECDAALIGIGVTPSAEWIRGSGVDPDHVLVDAAGRTALPNVFAAGDVARQYHERLGAHVRTEHWESAARQGAAAAMGMLGEKPPPPPPPSFWSDQYGMRIQYVGHADHADSLAVERASEESDLAVVYRRRGRVIGALAVDRPRELIAWRREIESLEPDTQQPEGVAA